MQDNIRFISNPSKVPERYKKYLFPVVVDHSRMIKKLGLPPKTVLYHPHTPTFNKMINEMKGLGVNITKPLYGFMLAGKFHATGGGDFFW